MQLFCDNKCFCEILGLFRQGVHSDGLYIFRKLVPDESAHVKSVMWCDKEPSMKLTNCTIRDGETIFPIRFISTKVIKVKSEEGLERPCHQVTFVISPLH